jgi:hypothetical protein
VVILDAVTWLHHLDILESRNRSEEFELVFGGEGDGDSVGVNKVCAEGEKERAGSERKEAQGSDDGGDKRCRKGGKGDALES